MTHLARGIVDAGDELAVYDNTAADSGSEGDGDKAVDSLPAPAFASPSAAQFASLSR